MKGFMFLIFTSFLAMVNSISAPNSTTYDYQFFPTNNTLIPVCIHEELLRSNIYYDIQERNTFGNATCLPADQNCRPAFQDCCSFYDCVESNCGCGESGYPLGYGKKYCQIFSNYPFEGTGSRWRDATLRCLQRALIPFSQCPPTTCEQLKQEAFDSHAFCYTSSGVCNLSPKDLLGILAITYGDILTMDGIMQILETAKRCGFKYILELELLIISKTCTLKDNIRKLLPELWRNIMPNWLLSSTTWEYKGSNSGSQGTEDIWKVKILLFHEDDTISMEEQAKQVKMVGKNLMNLMNSEEYVEQLNVLSPNTFTSVNATLTSDNIPINEPIINSSYKTTYPYLLTAVLAIMLFV
jgi:hypothetical protein